jgi:hypothetical protein
LRIDERTPRETRVEVKIRPDEAIDFAATPGPPRTVERADDAEARAGRAVFVAPECEDDVSDREFVDAGARQRRECGLRVEYRDVGRRIAADEFCACARAAREQDLDVVFAFDRVIDRH